MKNAYEVKQMLADGKTICIYDIETTGLKKPESRILSFSAVKVKQVDGKLAETDRIDILMNPKCNIPDFITSINNISNADVVNCPTEDDMCEKIINFLDDTDLVTGYNSHNFDNWFINQMSQRVRGISWEPKEDFDVLIFVKEKLTKGRDVENHRLGTIAEYFNVTNGLHFHNSIDDVIATLRVLEEILAMYSGSEVSSKTIIPLSAALWTRGPLKRLYINNSKNHSCYYDLVSKDWNFSYSEDENMIADILKQYPISTLILNKRTIF